jgi:tetraacyldisaccharide 4'-kinase
LISAIFAASARARRRWYSRRPYARRRLTRPVVSVGNLSVGGSGKTPAVAHLARQLVAWGERPAILSRGYGRVRSRDGVVVVREPDRVVGTLDESGDEPMMLACDLNNVAVLVSPDRYLAGCLAESAFDCTVHLLDDGFQHLSLARDIDLVIVTESDLSDRTLPSGRLREPLDTIAVADAVFVNDCEPARMAALGAARIYRLVQAIGEGWLLETRENAGAADLRRVAVVSGIARPARVSESARAAGWMVAETYVFPDHHPYSRADVDLMVRGARAAGAEAILTTPKDAVRLAPHVPIGFPVVVLPIAVSIEPAAEFEGWLRGRIAEVRLRPEAAGARA